MQNRKLHKLQPLQWDYIHDRCVFLSSASLSVVEIVYSPMIRRCDASYALPAPPHLRLGTIILSPYNRSCMPNVEHLHKWFPSLLSRLTITFISRRQQLSQQILLGRNFCLQGKCSVSPPISRQPTRARARVSSSPEMLLPILLIAQTCSTTLGRSLILSRTYYLLPPTCSTYTS
jgi:hypothetical protein